MPNQDNDLERRVAEALRPHCDGLMTEWMAADLAKPIAAALRATATRGVFAGRETMLLLDRKDEWPAVEQAKQDAEAAGLAALNTMGNTH